MSRRSDRLTRIVATIGPASESPQMLLRLARAGLDVVRLNMSHGDAEFHRTIARRVATVSKKVDRPIGLMCDLQGPKLRLGNFDGIHPIRRGSTITLTTQLSKSNPEKGIFPVAYRHLPMETERGHDILIDDGTVRLSVQRVSERTVRCKVLEGRSLKPRAGLNLPDAMAKRSALTSKDRRDIELAVELGCDFIALSFVRRPKDLHDARRLIQRAGGDQLLIAKIETAPAIDQLHEILEAADGVMVARGDLGVEMPPERVPTEQKRIIQAATAAGKPVITATQMLESMRTATRPTRAEASDVANAVWDGSWAVMLSAETAVGDYPVESIKMMNRIALEAERLIKPPRRSRNVALTVSEGIADAGMRIAFDIGATALVALTRTGSTARQIARISSPTMTYAYTPSRRTWTRMTLYRGITPRLIREQKRLSRAIQRVNDDLRKRRNVAKGDLVVILSGSPDQPLAVTTRLAVHQIR